MKVSRKETVVIYSLLVLMCFGVVIGSFWNEYGSIISTIVTSITAVVSAIAVYFQMRKDTEITQAEFLLEYSKCFYSYEGAELLEKKIDKAIEKKELYQYSVEDYELVYDYFLWITGLASMVENKTLPISLINNIYNYRFFTVVNNPSIQQSELCKFGEYYKSVYRLHKQWTDYRKKHNQYILQEDYDLSKVESYQRILAIK